MQNYSHHLSVRDGVLCTREVVTLYTFSFLPRASEPIGVTVNQHRADDSWLSESCGAHRSVAHVRCISLYDRGEDVYKDVNGPFYNRRNHLNID